MIPELEEIKRIFLMDWDPIGVSHAPEAADEYDSYAFQVFISLHKGATVMSISDYLDKIEIEHMGLARSGRSEAIAARIVALHDGRPQL